MKRAVGELHPPDVQRPTHGERRPVDELPHDERVRVAGDRRGADWRVATRVEPQRPARRRAGLRVAHVERALQVELRATRRVVGGPWGTEEDARVHGHRGLGAGAEVHRAALGRDPVDGVDGPVDVPVRRRGHLDEGRGAEQRADRDVQPCAGRQRDGARAVGEAVEGIAGVALHGQRLVRRHLHAGRPDRREDADRDVGGHRDRRRDVAPVADAVQRGGVVWPGNDVADPVRRRRPLAAEGFFQQMSAAWAPPAPSARTAVAIATALSRTLSWHPGNSASSPLSGQTTLAFRSGLRSGSAPLRVSPGHSPVLPGVLHRGDRMRRVWLLSFGSDVSGFVGGSELLDRVPGLRCEVPAHALGIAGEHRAQERRRHSLRFVEAQRRIAGGPRPASNPINNLLLGQPKLFG